MRSPGRPHSELFATLAQFFIGDTTPAARLRTHQLRLSERSGPASVDEATSTSELDAERLGREVSIVVADDPTDRGAFMSAFQTETAMRPVDDARRVDPALTSVKEARRVVRQ
jgi:hypothetical protein